MELLERTELRHGDGRRLLLYGLHSQEPLRPEATRDAQPAIHLRHDALTDRWVGISPARNARPMSNSTSNIGCPLCPEGPEIPFQYEAAVFDNRFPTLLSQPPAVPAMQGRTAPSRGACEVVLYTSTHTGSLATLTDRELARTIAIWAERSAELWSDPASKHVLVFENRGTDVGATLSHPHGQIYALDHVPELPRARLGALERHRTDAAACLTCSVVSADEAATDRAIALNDSFTIAVPFAPNWPYEIHVRAKRHGVRRMQDLNAAERRDLAVALREVVGRYDTMHEAAPLSYMMACQQAPATSSGPAADWHLAFEFYPPARAPGKLKVRASVETAAGFFINDTVPEESAALLSAIPFDAGVPRDIPDVVVAGLPDYPDPIGNPVHAQRPEE